MRELDGMPPPDYFFHKGGMFTMTRYLCRVLADKKIRVNSISPGGIFAGQHEQFLKNYTRKVPVGRLANNDDIKGVVVFLASEASAYINGENILMDGGMHRIKGQPVRILATRATQVFSFGEQ